MIEADIGEGLRQRGSSWVDPESSRLLLEVALCHQDLLEAILSCHSFRTYCDALGPRL